MIPIKNIQAEPLVDDRILCGNCANLNCTLHCKVMLPQKYSPIPTLPRRCPTFIPLKTNSDQRIAIERWPNLEEDLKR